MGYIISVMSEPKTVATEAEFEFSGGALCLDFANTVGDRPRLHKEKLTEYADLLRWAEQAGVLGPSDRQELERKAARREERSRRAFHHAVELREAIYRTFSALAAGDRPGAAQLAPLNAALLESLPHLRLESTESGYQWGWSGLGESLDTPLWPVIRSAAELLTSPEIAQIRECASETCSWLFIDRSRTKRRRWCDMSTCGNRAKARRHYQRLKSRATG